MKSIVSLESKNRDSNFELLRIIAMAMIVMGHFVVHGVWQGEFCSAADLQRPWNCVFENLIYSFCVCGVNIFVLISGYHKIKLKLKSFLSLWFLCAFYGIIAAIVKNYAEVSLFPAIVKALFISKSQWFFVAYLWLLLLSPILNAGLDSLSLKSLRTAIFLLFILNCFSGWVLDNGNADGYNVLHLIFIYSVGTWIKKETIFNNYSHTTYFIIFMMLSVLIFMSSVLSLFVLDGSNFPIYFYNNPLVVLASISFFCCFSKLKLQSNIINIVASTVVASIFIQDFIASEWIYMNINSAYNAGIPTYLINCLAFFLGIFIIAFLIDNFRQMICRPLIEKLISIVEKGLGNVKIFLR